jgi:hypothetical protein
MNGKPDGKVAVGDRPRPAWASRITDVSMR